MLTYKQLLPSFVGDGFFGVMVIGFVSVKLVFLLRGVDVLEYPEAHVSYVLFGGMVDDFEDWIGPTYVDDRPRQDQH